ncbi:acetyl/propionyl/methylcrotonyl-CoA carboxylase subunit alpha [Streptomyces sp. MUM 178J]|uniref:acetyl/propionyl/methylcrotonyl-CoA carboxylase subunit alpha n=1 Tax=Streptomyces sp. MUM 178J TaxID=2791991 RepID=UPI001F03DEB3|nr:biotin carboxylase N-terminal domain-containing protein [Streptomyces sp. MUM 178J]WRQ83312.1 biotin carboxylase N-terminal domain-containing protein [Streptomyces sp. MUM 178J]
MFDTVLVANRGEIAVRVIRTLRTLGVRSVAVFSDADADARHVREADTAVRIGPAPAAESYLRIDRLLDAAARTGAQAIHPGYGFLAENAAFAQACTDAGVVFIGPPASAISLMGDKIRAKETVRAAGVPVVPGSSGSGLSDAELAAAAREIGMPVLLKPSAGGGGKGMRLLRIPGGQPQDPRHIESALLDEIAAARREARASFGDDTLLVERWIDRPRHIEIQVLADGVGNVVHLGERECSLQRRHQKIIEEAPSVLLDEETRAAMGEAAVSAARSCGYAGAGTVEFIVPGGDPSSYYFMEMNTRLQVEHPVTELITGVDLVEQQLRIAAGEPLPFAQEDVTFTGHAIEARLCAEDPARGFLPSGGTVLALHEPQGWGSPLLEEVGGGIRTDSGLALSTEVSSLYDPMLSKVIAHAPDRPSALRRLRAALAATVTLGVPTNAGFLRRLLAHPSVASGDLDTGLVEREVDGLIPAGVPEEVYAAAALLHHAATPSATGVWADPFSAATGWRLGGDPAWIPHWFRVPGHDPVQIRTCRLSASTTKITRAFAGDGPGHPSPSPSGAGAGPAAGGSGGLPPVRERDGERHGSTARLVEAAHDTVTLELDGVTHTFTHAASPDGRWLGRDGDSWHVQDHDPVEAALSGAARAGVDTLAAPMPGTVTVVKVAVGDEVEAGQSLLVVEAMKMEHVISAPHAGTVTELDVTPGTTVAMDQVLAVVAPSEEDA